MVIKKAILLCAVMITAVCWNAKADSFHYFDETGNPLPQYESIYQQLTLIYPGSMPEKIIIVFTEDTASRFDTINSRILLSSSRFQKIPTYLIAHESSHLCLNILTHGASIKEQFRFFDEGYACIVGNLISGELESYKLEEALPTAAIQNKNGNVNFEKVQDWKTYFGGPYNGNYYAYPVGASFDFFILNTYGQALLDQFFVTIGNTLDLDSTFKVVFQKTKAEMEKDWLSYLASVDTTNAEPKVVKMYPENVTMSVPLNITEITVTFNTSMKDKIVFISNHNTEINYKNAYWKDQRTLAIRINGALKANTEYQMKLGDEQYGHFISRAGLELPVTMWMFKTGSDTARNQ